MALAPPAVVQADGTADTRDAQQLHATVGGDLLAAESAGHLPQPTEVAVAGAAAEIYWLSPANPATAHNQRDGAPRPYCEAARSSHMHAAGLTDRDLAGTLGSIVQSGELQRVLALVCSVFRANDAMIALFDDSQAATILCADTQGAFHKGSFPWRHSLCAWSLTSEQHQAMLINDTTADSLYALVWGHGGT